MVFKKKMNLFLSPLPAQTLQGKGHGEMLSNIEFMTGEKSVSLRGGGIFMWGPPLERRPHVQGVRSKGSDESILQRAAQGRSGAQVGHGWCPQGEATCQEVGAVT